MTINEKTNKKTLAIAVPETGQDNIWQLSFQ